MVEMLFIRSRDQWKQEPHGAVEIFPVKLKLSNLQTMDFSLLFKPFLYVLLRYYTQTTTTRYSHMQTH